ncbi:MAG: hypothetical protein J1E81_06290 [Eubacterium sp.]|nr:hypothetical protein [Eubacterium sp.]
MKKHITGKTQRKAVDAYRQRNPQAPIGTTFEKAEKEYIQSIYKAHGVTVAQILRGAAAALRDGQTIRTEREPLQIPVDNPGTSSDTAPND